MKLEEAVKADMNKAIHDQLTDIVNKAVRKGYDMAKAELIRCKDCKHFELNHWENVNGIPLIVAHEICTKWGDGCKTSIDGYCFMAERKKNDRQQ